MQDSLCAERIGYIDALKGLAIFLVVMGHVLSCAFPDFSEIYTYGDPNLLLVWRFIYSFHMALFMTISGYVAYNPNKRYSYSTIGQRVVKYLIPCVIASLLYDVWVSKPFVNQYWYLSTLALFIVITKISETILFYFRNKYISQLPKTLLEVITIFIIYIIVRNIAMLPLLKVYFCETFDMNVHHLDMIVFYLFGYVLRRSILINKFFQNRIVVFLSFVIFVAIELSSRIYNYHLPYEYHCTALPAIVLLWYVVYRVNLQHRLIKMLIYLGVISLEIYILHFFFLIDLSFVGIWTEEMLNSGKLQSIHYIFMMQSIVGIIGAGIVISCSCISAKFLKKIPIATVLLLGK